MHLESFTVPFLKNEKEHFLFFIKYNLWNAVLCNVVVSNSLHYLKIIYIVITEDYCKLCFITKTRRQGIDICMSQLQ